MLLQANGCSCLLSVVHWLLNRPLFESCFFGGIIIAALLGLARISLDLTRSRCARNLGSMTSAKEFGVPPLLH